MERSLADLARRSLACIEQELPEWSARLAARAPASIDVRVDDGEAFALVVECDRVSVRSSRAHASVSVALTRPGLRALVDGRRSLLQALRSRDLDLRGRIADLVAAEAALHLFLHAASRALGFSTIAHDWSST